MPIWEVFCENWPSLLIGFFVASLVAGSLVGAGVSFGLIWCGGKCHEHLEARRLARANATANATEWHDRRHATLKDYREQSDEETAKEVNDWPWVDENGNDLP
ncbi:MAG TPA: hypothetical protein VGB77_06590 [Abditibacteriaceae bacterium]|jgi:hypothetical protein